MKKFVFIVTDRNRSNLHVGISSDVKKTMSFYEKMPTLIFDGGIQLTRLIYFEELNSESEAFIRFNLLSKFTRTQKEKLIRDINPDWVDLVPALKVEKNYYSLRVNQRASHLLMQ